MPAQFLTKQQNGGSTKKAIIECTCIFGSHNQQKSKPTLYIDLF